MIVKNEEKNLPACLESVKEAVDEIIVVDTGSTDNTVEVAKRFGAKVYYFQWCDHFAKARNESLKHATCDYILWLDADDRMKKEDVKKLIELKKFLNPQDKYAFYFQLVNEYKDGRQDRCFQIRMFPNSDQIRFKGRIHETVMADLKRLKIESKFLEPVIRIFHMGYREKNRSKLERNLKLLLKALEEAPEEHIYYYYLGMTYSGLGETEKAKEYLKKLLRSEKIKHGLSPVYIAGGIELANLFIKENNFDHALEIVDGLYKDFPQADVIKLLKGNLLLKLDKPQEAISMYMLTDPKKLTLLIVPIMEDVLQKGYYLNLGKAYEKLGYLNLARDAYEKALDETNTDARAYFYLGQLAIRTLHFQEAIHYFQKALRFKINKQQCSRVYTLLGVAYQELNDQAKAQACFQKAIEHDCTNTRAKIHLAEILFDCGKIEETKRILKEIVPSVNGYTLRIKTLLSAVYAQELKLEKCVEIADDILKMLKQPRNYILNDIKDLIYIYAHIEHCLNENPSLYREKLNIHKTISALNILQQYAEQMENKAD